MHHQIDWLRRLPYRHLARTRISSRVPLYQLHMLTRNAMRTIKPAVNAPFEVPIHAAVKDAISLKEHGLEPMLREIYLLVNMLLLKGYKCQLTFSLILWRTAVISFEIIDSIASQRPVSRAGGRAAIPSDRITACSKEMSFYNLLHSLSNAPTPRRCLVSSCIHCNMGTISKSQRSPGMFATQPLA